MGRLFKRSLRKSFHPQAPVVQALDRAIHRMNHYPADEYYEDLNVVVAVAAHGYFDG